MVARDGIEPPTPAFSGPRSTTELPGQLSRRGRALEVLFTLPVGMPLRLPLLLRGPEPESFGANQRAEQLSQYIAFAPASNARAAHAQLRYALFSPPHQRSATRFCV